MKKLYFSLLTFLFFFIANAQIVNIPNAVFKAKLLQASSGNGIASFQSPIYNPDLQMTWTVPSSNKIDTNNDGEIQVSEALMVKCLNFNECNLTNIIGLEAFTNLQYLNIRTNSINGFNVSVLSNLIYLDCNTVGTIANSDFSGLSNLQYLDCSSNQLSTLNVSGLTYLKELNFNDNQIQNINISALVNLERFFCAENQLQNLNLSGLNNIKMLNCSNNQLTSLNLSGLVNMWQFYCRNNLLTTLIFSSLPSLQYFDCSDNLLSTLNIQNMPALSNLKCNNNQITTLSIVGAQYFNSLSCSNNFLTSLDVSGLTNLVSLDCTYNQLSYLNIKCGSSSFSMGLLLFYGNPNIQYVCADETKISSIQSKLNLWGYSSTCTVNSYCSFTPGGVYYAIQGNNRLDNNNNGCDTNDINYPNLKINISNGPNNGTLISNSSGNYSIPVSSGSHTFTPQFENPTYFTSSPASTTIAFPATASPFIQNFCITPNGVHHDLEVVVIPLIPARPGFDAKYKIKFKNKGNQNETVTLVFNFNDAILDYVLSTLAPTTASTGSLSWNIGTVAPFQSGEFVVTLNVNSPMETPAVNAGDILNYTAVINGLNTDETPVDNTFSLRQTVVNSYDPNDKTCLEGTTINPSMIGQYVHYLIRFENTGTFPAENIVVKDMIDTTKFDIATLQITDASHSCVTRITNPNKVEFIFEDINLPFNDATNDGYVVFKIKTKSTLVVGNTISNLANIYFDYNFPIVTNTATSTFQALATDEFDSNNALTLYPIPVKDNLNFSLKNNEITSSISIYNLLGQLIQTVTNPNNSIDVSNLQSGSYLIKVTTDKGISSGKFVKE